MSDHLRRQWDEMLSPCDPPVFVTITFCVEERKTEKEMIPHRFVDAELVSVGDEAGWMTSACRFAGFWWIVRDTWKE